MARRGENIHKRKDGRWEGRYIKARTPDRRICWGYIYGTTWSAMLKTLKQMKNSIKTGSRMKEATILRLKRILSFMMPLMF